MLFLHSWEWDQSLRSCRRCGQVEARRSNIFGDVWWELREPSQIRYLPLRRGALLLLVTAIILGLFLVFLTVSGVIDPGLGIKRLAAALNLIDGPDDYYRKGLEFKHGLAWTEAAGSFALGVELDPQRFDILAELGFAHRVLGEHEAAIREFREVLAQGANPESYSDFYYVGFAHLHLAELGEGVDHLQGALTAFDRAIALDANDADAYLNRGIVRRHLVSIGSDRFGFQGVIDDFDRAIALLPGYADAYANRGIAFLYWDKLEAGRQDFAQAVAIGYDPANPYRYEVDHWLHLDALVIERIQVGNRFCFANNSATAAENPPDLEFSGFLWRAKDHRYRVGPGPNCFTARNVFLDQNQHLRLKIDRVAGRWSSAELVSTRSFGYGKYTLTFKEPPVAVREPATLGFLTWDDAPEEFHREIDIEIGRKERNDGESSGAFTVQPWSEPGHVHLLGGRTPTSISFDWQADYIAFEAKDSLGQVIDSWSFSGSPIPTPGKETVRINLWLVGGVAPVDFQPVEVVIKSFEHSPGAPTDASN